MTVMNCYQHPDVAAVAFCRTCGRPLCPTCQRSVQGTVVCEEHAPQQMATAPPRYTVPDAYPYGRDLFLALRGTNGALSWSPSFEGVKETLFVCSDAGDFTMAPRRHMEFELQAHPGYTGILGVRFLADLAHAIRTGATPAITGEDGLRALEVVEAIYHSAETGKAIKL